MAFMRRLGLIPFLLMPGMAQALDTPLPDTGQSRCYDDMGAMSCPAAGARFFGQDAQHAKRPMRYRDNGDGTVSDLVTGLIWEKVFHKVSWPEAQADAAQRRTGGFSDWRVPSIKELYSLINFDGATGSARPETTGAPSDAVPYLDLSVFAFEYPSQGRFIDAQYVSSTAYSGKTMGGDASFFGVNFADGRIKAYPQNGGPGRRQWYARYVRGNPAYGQNDFVDQGDGSILDRATGLTWMKADSGAFAASLSWSKSRDGRLDWAEALHFCEGLSVNGKTGWRLPNAKELQNLVDYSRSPQATNSPAIAPLFQSSEIKDEAGKRNWPFYWSSTTHLDGPRPGRFAVYLSFGEAQGYPGRGMGQGGMGQGGMGGPPPMGPPPMGMGGPPPMGPPPMGGPMGMEGGSARDLGPLMDVHGAGAQRSSPKSGDESMLPKGSGPQGDILRIYNYARCVRD